jgi:hypothetical protein
MSLWISSNREADRPFPSPAGHEAVPAREDSRAFYPCVLAGLIGLSLGLVLGQIVAAHRSADSRIQWPAPAIPHPRTLPP